MNIVACTCPEGLGLPHSHTTVLRTVKGIRRPVPDGWVSIWVPWRELALAYMSEREEARV